ncbi:MAG TPA: MBL fold metallo-hydrolase [Verrucomicrobiae bacterium]|nr:MBL fold metallo-hydrolase [Verrucomicrobiae bacterium]
MARIPLEDNLGDIISKAQRGFRLADSELAQRAGLSLAQVRNVKSGAVDEPAIRQLAAALHLGPDALLAIATNSWRPRDPSPLDGFASFNTPFDDMTVNAYVAFDPHTRQAAAFDTGADADPMLQFIRETGLKLDLILLTHIHTDHVYELDRLADTTGAKAWVSDREPLAGAEPFADGREFSLGKLNIATRRTSGHAQGGTTFVVTGLARQLAVVGDALFAGSMGGGLVSYDEALRTNRASIFTLPDDTIICPGHGPLTTVLEEKSHNPFFPEFQQQAAQQQ